MVYMALVSAQRLSLPSRSCVDGKHGPELKAGQIVALKFPAIESEIKYLRQLAGRQGVPDVIDAGTGPGGQLFLAMPMLGVSLEEVLCRCDHDGLGGRVSWPAARCLGAHLFSALRSIHERGVLHCDIKPHNIMFAAGSELPYLVDFGLSRSIGDANFSKAAGTLDYLSIRACNGGERLPADELESVGWLLLRCVFGRLPWKTLLDAVPEGRKKGGDRVSHWKVQFLSETRRFGEELIHCPPELATYLRTSRNTDSESIIDIVRLSSHLAGGREHWAEMMRHRDDPLQTLRVAAQGRLLCQPPGPRPLEGVPPHELIVPGGFLVRLTGRTYRLLDGCWHQVDPVWSPASPLLLLEGPGCWVLEGTKEYGKLLVAGKYDPHAKKYQAEIDHFWNEDQFDALSEK